MNSRPPPSARLDRGDHRLRRSSSVAIRVRDVRFAPHRRAAEFLDVGAGGERAVRADHHDRAGGRISDRALQRHPDQVTRAAEAVDGRSWKAGRRRHPRRNRSTCAIASPRQLIWRFCHGCGSAAAGGSGFDHRPHRSQRQCDLALPLSPGGGVTPKPRRRAGRTSQRSRPSPCRRIVVVSQHPRSPISRASR